MKNARTTRVARTTIAVVTSALAVATLGAMSTQVAQAATAPNGPIERCTRVVHGPLEGAQVVAAGERLCLRKATVIGAITVQPGGALGARSSTVSGAISLDGAIGFRFCHSVTTAGGAITSTNGVGPVHIGSVRLHVTKKCRGNAIEGAVTIQGNAAVVTLAHNRIDGAVTANTTIPKSGVPIKIAANAFGGDLSCSGNSPEPTNKGRVNTVVGARSGQCASSTF